MGATALGKGLIGVEVRDPSPRATFSENKLPAAKARASKQKVMAAITPQLRLLRLAAPDTTTRRQVTPLPLLQVVVEIPSTVKTGADRALTITVVLRLQTVRPFGRLDASVTDLALPLAIARPLSILLTLQFVVRCKRPTARRFLRVIQAFASQRLTLNTNPSTSPHTPQFRLHYFSGQSLQ